MMTNTNREGLFALWKSGRGRTGKKKTILAKQIVSVSLCGCGKITSVGTVSVRNPDKPEVNAIELLA